MIKFINRLTHSEMWVADERKDEYLAAGHRLAATSAKPEKTVSRSEERKPDPDNTKAQEPSNKPVPSINRKTVGKPVKTVGKSVKKAKTSGKK